MGELCVICLEYINIQNKITNNSLIIKNPIIKKYNYIKLICDHIFHKKCIEKYFKSKENVQKKCPVCRELITESNDNYDDIIIDTYNKYDK